MSEIQAGRDTDARIARGVFGLEVAEVRYGVYMLAKPEAEFGWRVLPHFSTRIEDAWDIIEYFRPEWDITLHSQWEWEAPAIAWVAEFSRVGRAGRRGADAPTAPLAICRAAVKLREETP